MNITANTFFGKLKAENLGRECAEAAIEAGGSKPVDCEGKCLLPREPLEGDIDHFGKEMKKWKSGGAYGDKEWQAFVDTYKNIMKNHISKHYE